MHPYKGACHVVWPHLSPVPKSYGKIQATFQGFRREWQHGASQQAQNQSFRLHCWIPRAHLCQQKRLLQLNNSHILFHF